MQTDCVLFSRVVFCVTINRRVADNMQYDGQITACPVLWWANPNHIWDLNRDLSTSGDSTWTIKTRLKRSRFSWDLIEICDLFEKKRLKAWQISCLLTDVKRNAQITETLLLQMMLKLHCTNWLMLQVLWLYEIYHVWLIRPKINCTRYSYVDFLLIIYLHFL